MRSVVSHFLEAGDLPDFFPPDEGDENFPTLHLGPVAIVASFGQFAAIRDAIDELLAREEERRTALDRECRESSH